MKHKIHIPKHVQERWAEMTDRNDHTGVLWEIACFFSYAEFKYKEFEKIADKLSWIIKERDRAGSISGNLLREWEDAYDGLRALVVEGYGLEVWKQL